jgi:hypothetical protein
MKTNPGYLQTVAALLEASLDVYVDAQARTKVRLEALTKCKDVARQLLKILPPIVATSANSYITDHDALSDFIVADSPPNRALHRLRVLVELIKLSGEAPASQGGTAEVAPGEASTPPRARSAGRLRKEDSEAKRATMRAIIAEHRTMVDDYKSLAFHAGVSTSTARRFVEEMRQEYRNSKGPGAGSGQD